MADRPTPTPDFDRFKSVLDSQMEWPAAWLFKFIVPKDQLNHLLAILDGMRPELRESSGGKWVSVTTETVFTTSEEVIAVYRKTANVPRVIAL